METNTKKESINQRLKIFFDSQNLSNSMVAEATGMADATISRMINGKSEPHKSTIEKLCKCYPKLNKNWLISGTGEMLQEATSKIDWKEEAFNAVKEENSFLKKQLELLNNVVNTLLKNPNFLNSSLQAAKLIEIQGALAGDYKLAA